MILTRQISIDLSDNSTAPIIRLQQSCIGINIEFFLNNGGKPFKIEDEMSARILAEKPDGTSVYNNCQVVENRVIYEVTSQTIASAGTVVCQLQITRGDEILYSPRIELWVSENLSAEIESKNEYNAITAKEDKSNKVTELGESSTDAEYPSAKLVYDELAKKETLTNKVTSLTAERSDVQYPSAKAVYNFASTRIAVRQVFPQNNITRKLLYKVMPTFMYSGATTDTAIKGHVYQIKDNGDDDYPVVDLGANVDISGKTNY